MSNAPCLHPAKASSATTTRSGTRQHGPHAKSRRQGPARDGSWTSDPVYRAGWRHLYCDHPSRSATRRYLSGRGRCCSGSPDIASGAHAGAHAGGAVRGCNRLRADGPTGRRRAPAQLELPGRPLSTRRAATSSVPLQLPFDTRERAVTSRPALGHPAIGEPTDRGQARRVPDLLRAVASGAGGRLPRPAGQAHLHPRHGPEPEPEP